MAPKPCDTFRDDGGCTGEGTHPAQIDPWGGVHLWLCDACYRNYDNWEPGDPDGECFRGGEAAAYENDQMARMQRELK